MTEAVIRVGAGEHRLVPLEWYGRDSQEHKIVVRLEGEGASVDVIGVFLGYGNESFASDTTVIHAAPKTVSRTLFRGVLRESSRASIRGMVTILPGATGSQAGFEARALMLSPTAKAVCVPDLEILENDVLGATHAASVAPVDEEQLFYLRSRGLTGDEARTLLTEAFVWPALALLGRVPEEEAGHPEDGGSIR